MMPSDIKSFHKLMESYSMLHQKQLTDVKRVKFSSKAANGYIGQQGVQWLGIKTV